MPHVYEREQDVDAYREYVADRAEKEPYEVFLNRYPEHAAVIIEFLFRKANQKVEILTGKLSPKIYGDPDTVRAAINFLDRTAKLAQSAGPRLCILTEDEISPESHPLFVRARESKFLALIALRHVPTIIKHTYQFHFTIADSKHYRCKEVRRLPEAVVQFNAPDAGANLHSIFEKVFERSEPRDLV
jgi:hypothetical protein